MKASDLKPAKNIFALFIGKSGSGKDCAAASFPKPMKCFDLDLRSDGMSPTAQNFISPSELSKIDITKVTKKNGWTAIEREFDIMKIQYQNGQRPFETIYFGSATTFEALVLSEAKGLTGGHQKVGTKEFQSPADYKYLYSVLREFMDEMKTYPVNFILSAHTMDRYGKDPNDENEYAENIVLGEKLVNTDRMGEILQVHFGEVYRFEKRMLGIEPRHYVKFRTDVAKTMFMSLPNGEVDITRKNFYEVWSSYINKQEVEKKTA